MALLPTTPEDGGHRNFSPARTAFGVDCGFVTAKRRDNDCQGFPNPFELADTFGVGAESLETVPAVPTVNTLGTRLSI